MERNIASANKSSPDQRNSRAFSFAEKVMLNHDLGFYRKWKAFDGKIEADRESAGSSVNIESPRSVVAVVGKWPTSTALNKNVKNSVHCQVLKIREEDSHIGQDVVVYLSTAKSNDCRRRNMDAWISSDRPILPASPLGGKANKLASH